MFQWRNHFGSLFFSLLGGWPIPLVSLACRAFSRRVGALGLVAVLLCCAVMSDGRLAAAPPVIHYNLHELPSSQQAQAKLQRETQFTWRLTPLRDGLRNLANAYQLSIWIDRRIDPTQTIDLQVGSTNRATVHSALRQIAALVGAEVGLIENVVYFAPAGELSRLQLAATQLHDALSVRDVRDGRPATANMRPLQWEEVKTPNAILLEIAETWKVTVAGELPHDLWHAATLATPCTLATQLTVVCGGFEQQALWDAGSRLQLQPLQREEKWSCLYEDQPWSLQETKQIKSEYRGSSIAKRGSQWHVTAVTEAHLALLGLATRVDHKPANSPPMTARWTGEIGGVAERVLTQFAASQQLEVVWDATCTERQKQKQVRFDVKNASLTDILNSWSEAAELRAELSGSVVTVSAAPKP